MSNHNISHLSPRYTKFDGHYDLNKKKKREKIKPKAMFLDK